MYSFVAPYSIDESAILATMQAPRPKFDKSRQYASLKRRLVTPMTLKRHNGRGPKPVPAVGLFNLATKRLQIINGVPCIDLDPDGFAARTMESQHPGTYKAEQVFVIIPGQYHD
jgi:hypothetical protein